MAYKLTNDNIELLNIIYNFGGYTRINHIQLIHKGITNTAVFYKLDKLEKMKYLTSKRLKTNSKQEKNTYQITYPTCKLFNNPNSYFRKKHREEYIYRALIKNYFLCSIYKQLKDYIITENEKKIEFFKSTNFNSELFPRKYNKDSAFIHFEETVLNFTENNGCSIYNNDELLYSDISQVSIITYIDEYYKDPKKQVVNLINKYMNMIDHGGECSIGFLIITDDINRTTIYKKFVNNFIGKHVYTEKISEKLLLYYKDILLKFKPKEEHELILKNYKSGELKSALIQNISEMPSFKLSNEAETIINNVKLKGENFILEKVKEIINNYTIIEDSFIEIEKFFTTLFLLEYNKFISFGIDLRKKFDIKIYQIEQKIYE